MAGVITTASHPKALWPGIKAWWGQTYNEHPEEYVDLFDKDTSNQNYEEDVQLSGLVLCLSRLKVKELLTTLKFKASLLVIPTLLTQWVIS